MKKSNVGLSSLLIGILAFAGAQAEELRTIDGQVFIRTQGGDNIKLSLVEVMLFDEKVISENVEKKRKAAAHIDEYLQTLKQETEALEKQAHAVYERDDEALMNDKELTEDIKSTVEKLNATVEQWTQASLAGLEVAKKAYYPRSADYYFSDLPKPLQVTKTDADGKFAFNIPTGSYVLAAISSREAGDYAEKYHWMVKVASDSKIMLANDNLPSSGSSDSLVATLRYEPWENSAYEAERKYVIEQTGIAMRRADNIDKEGLRLKAEGRYLQAQTLPVTSLSGYLDTLAAFVENHKRERFRKDPKAAQRKAIELYPDLAVAGSPLNKEFVARMKRYQAEKKEFFAEPDWPIRLAKECSEDLAIRARQ